MCTLYEKHRTCQFNTIENDVVRKQRKVVDAGRRSAS